MGDKTLKTSVTSYASIKPHVILFGAMLIGNFMNSNQFLTPSNYYLPIVATILTSFFVLLINGKVKLSSEVIFALVILFNLLVGIMVAANNLDKGFILSYLLLLLLFFSIVIHNYNDNEISFIVTCYIVSAAIIALIMIIQQVPYYANSADRYTIQFSNKVLADPNFVGAYLSIPTLLALQRIFDRQFIKRTRIIYLIFVLLLIVSIFMTGSRAALLTVTVGMFFIFIAFMNTRSISITTGFKLFFLTFSSTVLLVKVASIISPDAFNRLFSSSYLDASNIGRIQIWKDALTIIYENPLGIGMQRLDNIISIRQTAHNSYLEIWLQFGFVGFISFMWLFLKNLKNAIKNRDFFLTGIILSFMLSSLFIAAGISIYFWVNLILITLLNRQASYM